MCIRDRKDGVQLMVVKLEIDAVVVAIAGAVFVPLLENEISNVALVQVVEADRDVVRIGEDEAAVFIRGAGADGFNGGRAGVRIDLGVGIGAVAIACALSLIHIWFGVRLRVFSGAGLRVGEVGLRGLAAGERTGVAGLGEMCIRDRCGTGGCDDAAENDVFAAQNLSLIHILTLCNVSYYSQDIAKGAVILLAVTITSIQRSRKK